MKKKIKKMTVSRAMEIGYKSGYKSGVEEKLQYANEQRAKTNEKAETELWGNIFTYIMIGLFIIFVLSLFD